MGFSKELAHFSFLSLSGLTAKNVKSPVQLDECCARGFDAADDMECGFARELGTSYVQPEPKVADRRKMRIERSKDKLQHVLFEEDGTAVLIARTVKAENRVDFFIGGEGLKEVSAAQLAAGPAFKMTYDEKLANWRFASKCCEKCAHCMPHRSCESFGGQTLAYVSHYKEEVGGGVAMCMDVDIPEDQEVWCPVRSNERVAPVVELTTKRPAWSSKLNSLTMDFKGRAMCASSKNFQLCSGDEDVVLVFGKQKQGVYCLDFEHPLSAAQAFGIALSTMYWT